MTPLTIQHQNDTSEGPCGLCGRCTLPAVGPRLLLADSLALVCQDCGKKHAPSLAALVHLAHVAERVGRRGRQTLVPSFGALLDLAHAAESYTSAQPAPRRRAA